MPHVLRRIVICGALVLGIARPAWAQELRYIRGEAEAGLSRAVVVPDAPLIHTAQLWPVAADGTLAADDVLAQIDQLWRNLLAVLAAAGSSSEQLVKLNVYTAGDDVAALVRAQLAERLPADHLPAVAYVSGELAWPGAFVGLDAVALAPAARRSAPPAAERSDDVPLSGAQWSVLREGARVYISGQAEPGDLAQATTATLESLARTLKYLGLTRTMIVQLKAFVAPIGEADVVRQAVAEFFDGPPPPLVLVEWKAGGTHPIEIELIASAGAADAGAPEAVEYLTPAGLQASPVFARVVRVRRGGTIYVSGLYGDEGQTAEDEVRTIFAQLSDLLAESGSDLRHLVKATYYVATDRSSAALNDLRPEYYDPQRPPAASKAPVTAVGEAWRTVTLDMLAVPAE